MAMLRYLLLLSVINCHLCVLVDATDCDEAPHLSYNSRKTHTPTNCSPTNCSSTVNGKPFEKADGLECTILNYKDNKPEACNITKQHYDSKLPLSTQSVPVEDVCYAKLTSIGLFMFHCPNAGLSEVSLTYTFQLPVCGRTYSSLCDSVMVFFNAKNDSYHNYFAIHPICRVFDYGGSKFERLTPDQIVEVKYDCMGIGIKDNLYTQVYYYLSFTAFPSGAFLNYTLLYQDVNEKSMRLMGATWITPTVIQVLFFPLEGVQSYLVEAVSGQWKRSKTVSSTSPSVEVSGIPPHDATVMLTVTPVSSNCIDGKGEGCPITMTLHKSLSLPVTGPLEPGNGLPEHAYLVVILVAMAAFIGVLIGVTVYQVIKRRRRNPAQHTIEDDAERVPLQDLRPAIAVNAVLLKVMLAVSSHTDQSNQRLKTMLQENGCEVRVVNLEENANPELIREMDFIVFCIHPTMPQSPAWTNCEFLIKFISESRDQLQGKVCFFSVCENLFITPSKLFTTLMERFPQSREFLQILDNQTYKNTPEGREKLRKEVVRRLKERREMGGRVERGRGEVDGVDMHDGDELGDDLESVTTNATALSMQTLVMKPVNNCQHSNQKPVNPGQNAHPRPVNHDQNSHPTPVNHDQNSHPTPVNHDQHFNLEHHRSACESSWSGDAGCSLDSAGQRSAHPDSDSNSGSRTGPCEHSEQSKCECVTCKASIPLNAGEQGRPNGNEGQGCRASVHSGDADGVKMEHLKL